MNAHRDNGSISGNALRSSRRSVLRAYALGGGLWASGSLTAAARGEATSTPPARRRVIYVFLSGGLSQQDSLDPKPNAPAEVRGEFAAIATSVSGVQLCEHLPLLAARFQKFSLLRSLTHPSNDHSQGHMIMLSGRSQLPTGFDPNGPQSGDWPSIAAVAGAATTEQQQLPSAAILPEKLIHRTGRTIPGQLAGNMGAARDPWVISASPFNAAGYGAYPEYGFHHERGAENPASIRFQAPYLELPEGLSQSRLTGRMSLLATIERQREQLMGQAERGSFDQSREQAVSLLASPAVRSAFDVTSAEDRWQQRYGRNAFGWSLLMARRLVAAGVNLVQVNLGNNETWDTHQSAFPNLKQFLLPPLDRGLSALLDDLDESGELAETLVVVAGEFGRTPRISTLPGARFAGRDHWGAVQTVLLAGGGVAGGQLFGASDRVGGYPAHDPRSPEQLAATMYHALGIPRHAVWHDALGRPHAVYHGDPIAELWG